MREPLEPINDFLSEKQIAYFLRDIAESLRIFTRFADRNYPIGNNEPEPIGYPRSTSEC